MARTNTDNFMIEEFQHLLVIHSTRTFDLLIEQFQDRDWIGIPHETFVIVVWFYILVIHFTRMLTFWLNDSKIETG